MDKMKFETPDGTAINIEKIAELFPAAVTEGKVNFDMLRTLLGDDVAGDEAYEFTWVGKRAAIAEAGRPIRKTLRPCRKESRDWDSTENLYIEGDNLDVLKLLQESYLDKVKMIYIDPPYNTGNDFIYRDNFTQSREDYDEESGVYDEDGDRLYRNTESNGRFHSDCMAESDGADGGSIPISEEIAERRNIRAGGSNETGGGVDPIEHRGGTGQKLEQGVYQFSLHSKGIEGGIGNTASDLRESRTPCRYGYFGSDGVGERDRENADCHHFKTENCPLKTKNYPDIGFRVLKLDETNMKDVYYAAGEYSQNMLDMMTSNIKDDRTDLDLLYGCLLDWGLPLSMPHTQERMDGFTVHTYNGGDLIACFAEKISEKAIREIASRRPLRAVFRDSGFTGSPEKINVFEIFKMIAPNTNVRVI